MCGLFGFSGLKSSNDFDLFRYKVLGLFNDARGGDSAGAFLDGEYAYGIDTEKYFADFSCKNEFFNQANIKNNTNIKLALGHCRRASVGSKTINQAQPVIIRNKDTNKIDFVMIHNGTLLNHQLLANKYLKDVDPSLTDSQIFAYLVYYYGTKIFKEYVGAGAFIFIDYRNDMPTMYVFKGASRNTYYTDKNTITEERPLFMVKTHNGYWFSSISESLEFIYPEYANSIKSVPSNTLYTFKEGKIIRTQFIDRTTQWQVGLCTAPPTYSKLPYHVSTYEPSNKSGYYNRYYGYDDYNEDYDNSQLEFEYDNTSYYPGRACTFEELFPAYSDPTQTWASSIEDINSISYFKGLYYTNQKVLSGEHWLSETGIEYPKIMVLNGTTDTFKKVKPFWFYKGILLTNEFTYYVALKINEILGDDFRLLYLKSLSYYPFLLSTQKKFVMKNGEPFSGVFKPAFQKYEKYIYIEQGFVKSIFYTPIKDYPPAQTYDSYNLNPKLYTENMADKVEKVAENIITATRKIQPDIYI